MANEYSVAIHDYLSAKIAAAAKGRQKAEQENDLVSMRYFEGRLEELDNIRQYMVDKIDLKTQTYY